MFDLHSSDDFNTITTKPVIKNTTWKECPDCKITMLQAISSYQCPGCGYEVRIIEQGNNFSTSIISEYNVNNVCSISIKVAGVDSYRYNRALLKTSSDYSKVQINTTSKQLNRYNAQSVDCTLPATVIQEAVDMYSQLQQQGVVRRGNGRKGALGACLSFVCKEHNIAKKPKEIANFVGIDEHHLSRGDKSLRAWHSEKKIDIPIHYNPTDAYIMRYFEVLHLDTKYQPLVEELIARSLCTDIIGESAYKTSTRCAGTIYSLILHENLPITNKDMVRLCTITITTFRQYYKFMCRNYHILNPIFIKYNIQPLPDNANNALAKIKNKNKSSHDRG